MHGIFQARHGSSFRISKDMRNFVLTLTAGFALTACVGIQAENPGRADAAAPPEYAALLKKYVAPEGVRYADWHGNADDMKKLEAVVGFYADTQPPANRDDSLAWHLNAYNAWILHNILKKYPTKGPLDGETFFFHGNRIKVAGKQTSFDHLEQKVIRPTFEEPRIHFALNCAAGSCPPLWNEPFRGDTLDRDLERLTREFINDNPEGVVPEGNRVKLSKIFEWYADDFGGKDNLVAYVNKFRNSPVTADANVEFLDYRWTLNETR